MLADKELQPSSKLQMNSKAFHCIINDFISNLILNSLYQCKALKQVIGLGALKG